MSKQQIQINYRTLPSTRPRSQAYSRKPHTYTMLPMISARRGLSSVRHKATLTLVLSHGHHHGNAIFSVGYLPLRFPVCLVVSSGASDTWPVTET